MELIDTEVDKIVSVKDEATVWEKTIKFKELKNNDHKGDLETIEKLKKYIDYDCLYAIDNEYGGCYGQGYIIIDKDLNYIGFVRTI